LLAAAFVVVCCGCSGSKSAVESKPSANAKAVKTPASGQPPNEAAENEAEVDGSESATSALDGLPINTDPASSQQAVASSKNDLSSAKPSNKAASPQISNDAFRMAAYEGRLDSVRSAIESGIDVNGVDSTRSLTALHMAAYNGHTETVKYLIQQGAKVDCRDDEGKTPLIHACTGPFAKSVQALLDAGADVNARDTTEGFTPLMMAAGLGQPEVVDVLLAHNADKSLVDDDQESAADHAKNSGHDKIVELLK
jgi:ankyrin repeat protein